MPAKAKKQPTQVKGIKGFNRDLTCRGHQFEVGKTYEVKGRIKACENGFHAIPEDQNPLQVLGYYAAGVSVFHEVTQSGEMDASDGYKLCSASITIGVEVSLGELIQRAVDWVIARAKPSGAALNSGDYGAASNIGTRGAASNSGDYGAASNSGYSGAASNSGDYGAASNSGTRGAASNSGTRGAALNSGDYGAASNIGTRGAALNIGYSGAASNSGYSGAASNIGTRGAASNSGYYGAAFSHALGGKVMCEGVEQALYCTEFANDGSIKSVACGITGQNGIKAKVWYVCKDGALVEAQA